MTCSECKLEKELTVHGTCWKCHLKGINFNSRIEARLPNPGHKPDCATNHGHKTVTHTDTNGNITIETI